ncbi:MAG: hypothetical protein AAGG38_02095 [Planctomycetota bacterium]
MPPPPTPEVSPPPESLYPSILDRLNPATPSGQRRFRHYLELVADGDASALAAFTADDPATPWPSYALNPLCGPSAPDPTVLCPTPDGIDRPASPRAATDLGGYSPASGFMLGPWVHWGVGLEVLPAGDPRQALTFTPTLALFEHWEWWCRIPIPGTRNRHGHPRTMSQLLDADASASLEPRDFEWLLNAALTHPMNWRAAGLEPPRPARHRLASGPYRGQRVRGYLGLRAHGISDGTIIFDAPKPKISKKINEKSDFGGPAAPGRWRVSRSVKRDAEIVNDWFVQSGYRITGRSEHWSPYPDLYASLMSWANDPDASGRWFSQRGIDPLLDYRDPETGPARLAKLLRAINEPKLAVRQRRGSGGKREQGLSGLRHPR